MPIITANIVAGLARHLLTSVGGAIVTAGYLDGSDFSTAVGALSALVGVGWSVYQKYAAAKNGA